jgi:hypothetical protein
MITEQERPRGNIEHQLYAKRFAELINHTFTEVDGGNNSKHNGETVEEFRELLSMANITPVFTNLLENMFREQLETPALRSLGSEVMGIYTGVNRDKGQLGIFDPKNARAFEIAAFVLQSEIRHGNYGAQKEQSNLLIDWIIAFYERYGENILDHMDQEEIP